MQAGNPFLNRRHVTLLELKAHPIRFIFSDLSRNSRQRILKALIIDGEVSHWLIGLDIGPK